MTCRYCRGQKILLAVRCSGRMVYDEIYTCPCTAGGAYVMLSVVRRKRRCLTKRDVILIALDGGIS